MNSFSVLPYGDDVLPGVVPTVSVVVPVYNEVEVLPAFFHALSSVIATLEEEVFEVVFVNDGSDDASWEVIKTLPVTHCYVECINLSRNFGKEAAVSAGLDAARGDAVIIMDADLQDPPELMPEMLGAWRDGHDVVNMKRRKREGESHFKVISAKLYYRLLGWLSDGPVDKGVGDFRLLSREVVDVIRALPERNRYMKGVMSWPGYRQITLSFDRPARQAGETKWSFVQLVGLGLSGITAFSVKPLKLAIWGGSLLSLGAFGFGVWILLKTLVIGETTAGFPSLILTQLLLGGVQLLAIGIVGEYVGRTFTEVKGRPLYLVMEKRSLTPTVWLERQYEG